MPGTVLVAAIDTLPTDTAEGARSTGRRFRAVTGSVRARVCTVLAVLLVGAGIAVVDTASPADAAVPRNSVVWGKSYHHKSYLLHQVPGRPGPLALHSYDGLNDFVVNANGDLSTSRQHRQRGGSFWYAYWRAHSNGAGAYFYLQRDGNMIVKARNRSTIVWKSGHYLTAGRYNFALTIANSGTLTEYYSSGNPLRASGRHVLWSMGRLVGGRHVCGGGDLQGSTSTYSVLLQDGSYDVSVRNSSFITMGVTVSRWYRNRQLNPRSGEIAPGAVRDFGIQWNIGRDFQTAAVRVAVTSTGATSGDTTVIGHCWYQA